jgi:F-type H+-transporting ATPase subunit alpha
MANKEFIIESLKKQIAGADVTAKAEKVGTVLEVQDGIARVSGLSDCMSSEMLEFPDAPDGAKTFGVALNLEDESVGAVILGGYQHLKEGDTVRSTGRILSINVSDDMIGRTVNPLGEVVDGLGALGGGKAYPIEKVAPGVVTRQRVSVPLQTGIKAIDAMIPIGRGQRELIIGDRQTGKTAVALDTIINQKGTGVVCIYVAIGQKESKIARIKAKLEEAGAMAHTIIVLAGASDPASLSYIAPYAGAAIGEYFMDQGQDALVIYDDLSKHAWAYRQISLLLRRPPGREAYPGDVFYLHSRLLERACRRNKEYGGGSLTALPIIETQAGDVSAYIPTNVISITDGQIYLDPDLFYRGIRPALNIGISVSRVGGDAQTKIMKKVAGKLRLDLAQFREMEAFAQFASDLDESTRRQIERGRRTVEMLKQVQFQPMPFENQASIIYAVINGYLDDVEVEGVHAWEEGFHAFLRDQAAATLAMIREVRALEPAVEESLKTAIADYKKTR